MVAQQQQWEQEGRPANDPEIIQPPLPYEHVMTKIQDIAHRTSLSDHIFPIEFILTHLCKYSIEQGQDERIGADPAWPIILFMNLHVPYPSITRVLERILDAQEAPFTGRRRKVVVLWIVEVLLRWAREAETQGTAGGMGRWVEDLLNRSYEAMEEVARLDERAGRAHAGDTQTIIANVRELQGWVQDTLGSRGTTGVRLF